MVRRQGVSLGDGDGWESFLFSSIQSKLLLICINEYEPAVFGFDHSRQKASLTRPSRNTYATCHPING
ncbi:hypothetical protein I7I48_08415 [Histoplasma ohiense]|nr:hypothetical protein I7I48_08415 [Histoplasma ohiense (nom. inval.)]